jgi:hypothetical protein
LTEQDIACQLFAMRRHLCRAVSIPLVSIHPPIRLLLVRIPLIHIHSFHTSPPAQKKRSSDSKVKRRDEREARKHALEEEVGKAEEWLESHKPNHPDPIQGKRAMLLEEVDPFDMDDYKTKLREAIDRFKKEGHTIKQGRSDPEMISSLKVELPEEYGGKVPFLDCAAVGVKPGDARSLLITIFDPAVSPPPAKFEDTDRVVHQTHSTGNRRESSNTEPTTSTQKRSPTHHPSPPTDARNPPRKPKEGKGISRQAENRSPQHPRKTSQIDARCAQRRSQLGQRRVAQGRKGR